MDSTSEPAQVAGRVLSLLASIGGALFLLSCKGEVASPPNRPVPEIGVVIVTPQSVPDEPQFIGQAEASRIVEIRSQVTGLIQERYFQEGRKIKKGDRLYRIDPVYVVVNVPEAFLIKRQEDIETKKIQHPGVYRLTGTLILLNGKVYPYDGTWTWWRWDCAVKRGRSRHGSRSPTPEES